MKFLVIGLGSMGKRRVRNLQALGAEHVAGFDVREDRRVEAHTKYGIPVFADVETAIAEGKPDAVAICTPPDLHMHYAFLAQSRQLDCFIEASVVQKEEILRLDQLLQGGNTLALPSCTMLFYPGPKKIKELVEAKAIGEVISINYHTGQYLPDWHPWEDIAEFYVSKRETGGAREIVPFELTWLCHIFGIPKALACWKGKLSAINADIDDLYHCIMQFPQSGMVCNMTVEVISRPQATREMRILGTEGEIVFSGDANSVRYRNIHMPDWVYFEFKAGTVENQYINPEEPYIEEMRAWTQALVSRDASAYPNSLREDYQILKVLSDLEALAEGAA